MYRGQAEQAYEPNEIVQKRLYSTLLKIVAKEKENEEKTICIMDKLLKRTQPPTIRLEPADPVYRFVDAAGN